MLSSEPKILSLGAMLRESCAKWGDKTAIILPTKPRTHVSYSELYEKVFRTASALHSLGLRAGDKVNLFAENCLEWAVTDWAAQTLGVITVPIYPTLPGDQASYIVKDSGSKFVFAGSNELIKRLNGLVDARLMLLAGDDSLAALANTATMDREAWEAGIGAVDAHGLATIIYTSGTTGDPKGAMLSHDAFTVLCKNILETIPVNDRDTFLSFLPLSHVYERFAGHVLPISLGATIAYAGSLATLGTDMKEVQPTIMLCVPRLLEATRERILDNVAKSPPLRQFLFKLALEQGRKHLAKGFAPLHGILDSVVAAKVRERTGGKLRFFVNGGGALPAHVADFFRPLGIDILQGYGLTETCAATSLNHPETNIPSTVGEPIKGMEIKIADDGEILIRGVGVMKGYFNHPEATAEAIDADGWFHSGDIGEFVGKHLKITDRKKDIIVLGNGKNVAPQKIENTLRESRYIKEAALFGDGQPYICGLIVPDFDHLAAYAKEAGIEASNTEALIQLEAVKALIKKEIDRVNHGLSDFEKVKKFEIIGRPFSVESGEMTPSLKLKRKVVRERFADLISSMQRG